MFCMYFSSPWLSSTKQQLAYVWLCHKNHHSLSLQMIKVAAIVSHDAFFHSLPIIALLEYYLLLYWPVHALHYMNICWVRDRLWSLTQLFLRHTASFFIFIVHTDHVTLWAMFLWAYSIGAADAVNIMSVSHVHPQFFCFVFSADWVHDSWLSSCQRQSKQGRIMPNRGEQPHVTWVLYDQKLISTWRYCIR